MRALGLCLLVVTFDSDLPQRQAVAPASADDQQEQICQLQQALETEKRNSQRLQIEFQASISAETSARVRATAELQLLKAQLPSGGSVTRSNIGADNVSEALAILRDSEKRLREQLAEAGAVIREQRVELQKANDLAAELQANQREATQTTDESQAESKKFQAQAQQLQQQLEQQAIESANTTAMLQIQLQQLQAQQKQQGIVSDSTIAELRAENCELEEQAATVQRMHIKTRQELDTVRKSSIAASSMSQPDVAFVSNDEWSRQRLAG